MFGHNFWLSLKNNIKTIVTEVKCEDVSGVWDMMQWRIFNTVKSSSLIKQGINLLAR
jgi:hypothetical protein